MPGTAIFLPAPAMSFLSDAIVLPRSAPPQRRNAAAPAMHGSSVATMFLLALTVSVRPVLAGFVAMSLTGLLTVVSDARYAPLREPLVSLDSSLFSQLSQYPCTYLPFLSFADVLTLGSGVAVFVGTMVLGMSLQDTSRGLLLAGVTASFLLHARAM